MISASTLPNVGDSSCSRSRAMSTVLRDQAGLDIFAPLSGGSRLDDGLALSFWRLASRPEYRPARRRRSISLPLLVGLGHLRNPPRGCGVGMLSLPLGDSPVLVPARPPRGPCRGWLPP
jgi:hypothetical protein